MAAQSGPAMFVTWEDAQGKAVALSQAGQAYGEVMRLARAAPGSFRDISRPNVSARDAFDRSDYDYFRPGESIPTDDKDIQLACMQAYDRFPIVRNVIDMMADFVVKGIDVVHPSPRNQKTGQEWFRMVAGKATSGKLASLLFQAAAAPVQRQVKRLSDASIESFRSQAAGGLGRGEIPAGYAVLNPASVEVIGGSLAPFVDPKSVKYAVRVPSSLANKLRNPRTPVEQQLINAVPPSVLEAALSGERLVPLAPERTVVVHYKKQDFHLWAKPLLYPLLDDLQMLNKLKQADRSALDGAISHIRLWRLGSLQERIFPTADAISRLAEMLLHNVGGGVMDLIWGPELDLVETSTEIHRFLGAEKYVPTLASIYQGLGVPPTLTGTAGDSGFTNNFVSLRILVERLEYCRQVLIEFWERELAIVQAAFGYRQPFRLTFDVPVLSDDSAEKKLLVDLADRNLISDEFLQERFGADPEIEAARLRRQERLRKAGEMAPKAGPFHVDSQQEAHLTRMFVQQGEVTPSEVGIELKDRKPGEVPPADKMAERKKAELALKKPPQSAGRPKGAGDAVQRKTKRVTPKQSSSASYAWSLLWASNALEQIDGWLKEPYLMSRGKKTLRQLSVAEAETFEGLKFATLCGLESGVPVTEESVRAVLEAGPSTPPAVAELYQATRAKYVDEHGAEPPVEQCRKMQSMVYALHTFELEEPDA